MKFFTGLRLLAREIERVDSAYRSALSVQEMLKMIKTAKFHKCVALRCIEE